jgi:hypothetical protein
VQIRRPNLRATHRDRPLRWTVRFRSWHRARVPRKPARIPAGVRSAFDITAVVALVVVAYIARRGSLPSDGLWFDDSWVAAGAIHGHLTSLLRDGSGTPGFIAILMSVYHLGTGSLHSLGIPSLVAGVAGPALLYVALRSVGYERSIAALVSAALVVARIHILYSGRVKGYTFDTVWVLLLVFALPQLARRTWRWPLAVAWAICAIGIASFSAYMMLAAAGAGLILALHPASDRRMRYAAVGAQGVAQLAYLVVSEKTADLNGIEKVLEVTYKAHIDFTWNPVHLASESLMHLRRVAQVFPGGSGGWLTVFGLLAIAGLVAAALRGRRPETIAARYLLLLIVMAYFGSLLHKFPFGPINDSTVSPGGRHTLWLIPAMALGLAAVAHRVRRWTEGVDALRFAFDGVAVAAAIVLVAVSYQPAAPAPFPGSESATRFVEDSLRPGDVVLITGTSTFSFADSARTPVKLVSTPEHQVGFAPVFADPRIHVVGVWAVSPVTPSEIRAWVQDAKRVFVVASGALALTGLTFVKNVLQPAGFKYDEHNFQWTFVQIWRPPSG